jgi:hypothetical protein
MTILENFEFDDMPRRKIQLDSHDEALMQIARAAILEACKNAHSPSGVARCVTVQPALSNFGAGRPLRWAVRAACR